MNGYIKFGHRNARYAVMNLFCGNQASLKMGSQIVKIRYGKTAADSLRDQALYAAEAANKKHTASAGKSVEKMIGAERCVKVDGVIAFQKSSRRSENPVKFSGLSSDLQES